jgi:hypothetical protein
MGTRLEKHWVKRLDLAKRSGSPRDLATDLGWSLAILEVMAWYQAQESQSVSQ